MKKKLNAKFMLIAAIAIVATAACSVALFYSILIEQIFDDLKANAHVLAMLGDETRTRGMLGREREKPVCRRWFADHVHQ